MRKTYMMLLALVLTVMGATNAMGQKIYRAELDKSMFKAWTSNEPGATEDADPAPEPKSNKDIYIIIGTSVAVIGVAACVIVCAKKKKSKTSEA